MRKYIAIAVCLILAACGNPPTLTPTDPPLVTLVIETSVPETATQTATPPATQAPPDTAAPPTPTAIGPQIEIPATYETEASREVYRRRADTGEIFDSLVPGAVVTVSRIIECDSRNVCRAEGWALSGDYLIAVSHLAPPPLLQVGRFAVGYRDEDVAITPAWAIPTFSQWLHVGKMRTDDMVGNIGVGQPVRIIGMIEVEMRSGRVLNACNITQPVGPTELVDCTHLSYGDPEPPAPAATPRPTQTAGLDCSGYDIEEGPYEGACWAQTVSDSLTIYFYSSGEVTEYTRLDDNWPPMVIYEIEGEKCYITQSNTPPPDGGPITFRQWINCHELEVCETCYEAEPSD